MPTYESSILISAEAGAVWHVLSDVAKWPEWLPTVTKVTPLDTTSIALGTRFVVLQPKLRPAKWKVTHIETARRFVWVARSPGLRMVAEHAVTPHDAGSSTVVLRFTFAGLLGGIIGKLFRSITEQYLAQEAAALKSRVERSP